ncbi:MAG: hypothetical protein JWQ11_1349, partial [Rhizobacter sp.]|nr:hypothetical protein [Rhizobacter sp.]
KSVASVSSLSSLNDGPAWSELTSKQRDILKPLEREWTSLDGTGREKWIEIAARFPKLPAAEQSRVEERMSEWARMTPRQRGEARLRFQQAKTTTAEERQQKWEAYQALPPEEKQRLSKLNAPAVSESARRAAERKQRAALTNADGVQAKSNIVTNPLYGARPKSVGPTLVQGGTGVSTHLLSKAQQSPAHQQTGMPKIAATADFVDSQTLLPKRGPQGAATVRPQRPVWVDPSLPAPITPTTSNPGHFPGSPAANGSNLPPANAVPTASDPSGSTSLTAPATGATFSGMSEAAPAASPQGPVMSSSERSDPVPEKP